MTGTGVATVTTNPAKGDTIRWTQRVNGRNRQFTGKVETVHARS